MIAKDGDVVWCARCERKAAVSYCKTWLCAQCFAEVHQRDPAGNLHHLLRGDALVSDDRGMMAVKVQFTPDEAPLIRRPKRRRG